jgi:hypothetical protein
MKKRTLAIGTVGVAALVAGGWALAQSAGPPSGFGPPFMHGKGHGGMGPGMTNGMHGKGMHGMHPGMTKGMGPVHGRGSFADPAQIETLKGELGITPAQEAAWGKYAKAVQDAAAAMKTARESVDPRAVSGMSPADRFAFVSKVREQGQKQFEAVATAANELLGVLDDTQKAKADDMLPGVAFGPGPMWGPFAKH